MKSRQKWITNEYFMLMGVMLVFLMMYLFTLPQQWLINDSYSYFNRALAFATGEKSLLLFDAVDESSVDISGSKYALGNATWLSLWIIAFGSKGVFISSLFCTVGGIFFISKAIDKAGYSLVGVFWLLLLLPLQFYSRTLMSCMPSFLLASIFLYLLVTRKDSGLKWLMLCALATSSLWFRETNILLLGGICLVHFAINRKYLIYYAAGSILGLLPRLISHHNIYGDAFQYLFSEGLSIKAVLEQFWLYLAVLMVLYPASIFFIAGYRGVYKIPLQTAIGAFVLLYIAYDYNASSYSGFLKGALINSRFMLPLAPFACFMCTEWLGRQRLPTHLTKLVVAIALMCTIGSQVVIHKEQVKHRAVSQLIKIKYGDQPVFYDMSGYTNVLRYINPLATDLKTQGDVKKIADRIYLQSVLIAHEYVYVILSDNQAGIEKQRRTAEMLTYLDAARTYCDVTPLQSISIESGLTLQVLRLSKK